MPVDTDPGPPEERTLDSVVLSGRSERKKTGYGCLAFNRLGLSSGRSGSGVGLTSRDTTVGILASTNCLASGKDMPFSTRTR